MEDFVTFEIAKNLKEKGFNLNCESFYVLKDFTAECVDDCGNLYEADFTKGDLYLNYPIRYMKYKDSYLSAPTISQVLKWLRKEKQIVFGIIPMQEMDGDYLGWCITIYKVDDNGYGLSLQEELYYQSYEEAALAGIEYVLDNLI